MNNNVHIIANPKFEQLLREIQSVLPKLALVSIILNYLVTAVINVYSVPLPKYIAIPGALVLVIGRFMVVFMDYLSLSSKRSRWPAIAASILTVFALIELFYSLRIQFTDFNQFISAYFFIGSSILLGYVLELNFIIKGMDVLFLQPAKEPTSSHEKHIPNQPTEPAPMEEPERRPFQEKDKPS